MCHGYEIIKNTLLFSSQLAGLALEGTWMAAVFSHGRFCNKTAIVYKLSWRTSTIYFFYYGKLSNGKNISIRRCEKNIPVAMFLSYLFLKLSDNHYRQSSAYKLFFNNTVFSITRYIWVLSRTTDTQRELFFKNLKFLGLGRQIGPKFYEAFWVFLAKL